MYINREIEYEKMKVYIDLVYEYINKLKEDVLNYDSYIDNKTNKLIEELTYIINETYKSTLELKRPFLLFVVGTGNYGKSTIINLLLRKEVINTSDLPNTWKIDLFIDSPKDKMQIIYNEGKIIETSINKGENILKEEENKIKVSKHRISKELVVYKNNNSDITKLKEHREFLKTKYLYTPNIKEVRYFISEIEFLEEFILVDTPGLNQTLLSNTEERLSEYYSRCDGVIWLIDAQNIVSNNTNTLLNELENLKSKYLYNKKIILVVNKIDIIRNNNPANLEKVIQSANEIFKNKCSDIVFISAKEELKNISYRNDLTKSIDKNIRSEITYEQINSKYKNINLSNTKVKNIINNYKSILYKNLKEHGDIEYDINSKTKVLKEDINKLVKYTIKVDQGREFSYHDYLSNIKNIEDTFNSTLIELSKKIVDDYGHSVNINNYLINVSKSDKIIINYNLMKLTSKNQSSKKSILTRTSTFSKIINSKDNNIVYNDYLLQEKLNKIQEYLNKETNDKICALEKHLIDLLQSKFTKTYIKEELLNNHIQKINELESILKNMG